MALAPTLYILELFKLCQIYIECKLEHCTCYEIQLQNRCPPWITTSLQVTILPIEIRGCHSPGMFSDEDTEDRK